jgi:phage shock protein A
MNLFKRLSVSVRSQLDEAVSRIENHDALIEAALRESREAIARLKLQQSRIQRKMQSIDAQLEALQKDEKNWVRRAKSLAKSDEAQALACLERRDKCLQQIEQLHRQREQCGEMEFRLGQQLVKLEQRFMEDERRLQEFRGRDLSVKAELALQEVTGSGSLDLEQAFDRWELDITRKEMGREAGSCAAAEFDSLEERLQREEQLEARKAQLKALMEDES